MRTGKKLNINVNVELNKKLLEEARHYFGNKSAAVRDILSCYFQSRQPRPATTGNGQTAPKPSNGNGQDDILRAKFETLAAGLGIPAAELIRETLLAAIPGLTIRAKTRLSPLLASLNSL